MKLGVFLIEVRKVVNLTSIHPRVCNVWYLLERGKFFIHEGNILTSFCSGLRGGAGAGDDDGSVETAPGTPGVGQTQTYL
jgi:hypothetical protein